jgi:hypothetical protein
MKTYKLGNKIKCIIRSCAAGKIGDQEMKYGNQPYTVLKDVEASFTFAEKTKTSKSIFNELQFSQDNLQEITISNIELNDKILNLIFSKNEDKLCSTFENCCAEDNKIYISAPTSEIYQVFIYDVDGELEEAFGVLNNMEVSVKKNEDYLVFYSYEGDKAYSFDRKQNQYLSLDLILEGNVDDELHTSFIHIDKCSLEVDKNMSFNRTLNAVDLKFIIIGNENNYITLE